MRKGGEQDSTDGEDNGGNYDYHYDFEGGGGNDNNYHHYANAIQPKLHK